MTITQIPTDIAVSHNEERGGLNLTMVAPSGENSVSGSPRWQLAGWTLQFAYLAPNTRLSCDSDQRDCYVKVITGKLQQPQRSAYAEPFTVRNTQVSGSISTAGEAALIAIFLAAPGGPNKLSNMDEIVFSGEHAPALQFELFHDKFNGFTDIFKDADAYMTPGIHLLDELGEEISNVIFWTAGKGVGLSTHNHGAEPSPIAPAFAEVHWVLSNGTGNGGMYLADDPDQPANKQFPMQVGDEHGPFFHIDQRANAPQLKPNGAVDYPWHGWAGGTDNEPGQAYDLVCAFEITSNYAVINKGHS